MNLILFLIILLVSFIAVRIGAIAFQLTGLEWSLAKFQALSCFTGTGFTTRESELITGNPQRRKIASVLIVLGHAGLVTMIATFANTLRPGAFVIRFTLPFLNTVFPSYLVPWANLVIMVVSAFLIYKVFANSRIATKLTDLMRSQITKKQLIKPVTFSELMIATGGYGVSQVKVSENSSILNKALVDSHLRSHDITVLAIERDEVTIPNPSANTKILLNDTLICFGKLGNIRKHLCDEIS